MKDRMTLWRTATLKSAIVPGGVILAVASLFIPHAWITLSPSALEFSYYAVFIAALALSLRFRSLRIHAKHCVASWQFGPALRCARIVNDWLRLAGC